MHILMAMVLAAIHPQAIASGEQPHPPSWNTPGLDLVETQRATPGWSCPQLKDHLERLKLHIFLRWVMLSRPRDLEEGTFVIQGRTIPATEYGHAEQADLWRRWDRPIEVTIRMCAPDVRDTSIGECPTTLVAATKSSGHWLADATAEESVVTCGLRLVPAECANNSYWLKVTLQPTSDAASTLDAVTHSLAHSDDKVRVSALKALGAMGEAARPALEAIQRLEDSPVPGVRAAAQAAAASVRKDGPRPALRPKLP